ncbi:MAG: OFA family MFS transporter [Sandaracinaceae bacterium]
MLDRASIVAPVGWSRWLVPPAALAVHLAIGQAYAWSVFKPPLEDVLSLSGTESALPFQLGIVMLGLSAAFGGTLVETKGPRWAMAVAGAAWAGGFLVAAVGVLTHQYWLVVLGYGGIGGIGLGIGYISPVSTLIKWFPDRPGLATGIAIMGFGGGALIASPWSSAMLDAFGREASGVATAFAVHGVAYALLMSLGVWLVRVPRDGWRPAGWDPAASKRAPEGASVSARNAIRTPQFWLLWLVLCLNVTAGIGILEKAAPMLTDSFSGTSAAVSAGTAAGFVALLSAANMIGRIVWSSTSDAIGRKNVYRLYLGVGALLYLTLALAGASSRPLFVLAAATLISFYGGGFATVPAYLRDLFGTYQVGAIHGRLLTAWSLAGILGPLIVNAIADVQEAEGESGPALYRTSFFVMIGLLAVGFVCNELIRPVHERHREPASAAASAAKPDAKGESEDVTPRPLRMAFAWLAVGVPFAYGVVQLARKVLPLFA